jgi:hypothetical protein
MNSLKLVLLTATIMFAMAFTFSCSSNDDDERGGVQGEDFNESSQVYNYAGSGIIVAATGIGCSDDEGSDRGCDYGEPSFIAGSVTNGVAKLELPRSISDEYLNKNFKACPASENIKIFRATLVLTDSNRKYIGKFDIGYMDEQIEEGVVYWYFSKAVKATCNFEEEEDDRKYKYIINIDAKAGLNKIYFRVSREGNVKTENVSTNNVLANEAKWTLN